MMWKYLKRGKTCCKVPQIMTGIIHTHFPIGLKGNIMYCKLTWSSCPISHVVNTV